MDPLGFGLENFDVVGAWRASDGKIPIDSSGALPDSRTFQGPDGLKTILKADRDAFAQCLTSKLLTFALGRGVEPFDAPAVREIVRNAKKSNYRFSTIIEAIVRSVPFTMRNNRE